jgi:acetyl esterase/lipase
MSTGTNTEQDEQLPVPHSFWRHPAMSWTDFLLSYIVSCLWPLRKLANFSPHEPNHTLQDARSGSFATKESNRGMTTCATAWSKSAGCEIAQVIFMVPRKVNVLQEWGFEGKSEKVPKDTGIPVHLFFPMSIIEGNENVTIQELTEYGFRKVKLNDLSALPAHVPLTIFFHGGAFVLDNAFSGWVALIPALLGKQNKTLIVASVEYSLAPEYPFPTPVEEALTVASYILDHCPDRKVHFAGISAGASLAAIAAMECFRKYPGRIASALIGAAFIDPKADSLSYYMNNESSHFVSVGFLRWGWQAYLNLPPSKDTKPETVSSKSEALGFDSNRTTWSECKWNGTPTERLITPQVDLPVNLDSPGAPKILVTTNQADPLMDEGLYLVAKLQERSAKVIHFDHTGTHWVGTVIDKALLGEVVEAWGKVLYSS